MKQKITNFHDDDILHCSWGNEKKGCRLLIEALEADECYKAEDILNRFFKNDRTSCTSN